MLISVTHLVDLVAGSQGTVGSGGWGGPDEFHTRVVPLGVKGVVGGDEDGQAVGVLSRNGKQTYIHENIYIRYVVFKGAKVLVNKRVPEMPSCVSTVSKKYHIFISKRNVNSSSSIVT